MYMELKIMKQEETKRVEVYYKKIQKLGHGLQILTKDNFLTIVFKAGLQSCFKILTIGIKHSTLQQHKEAAMLCEESMTSAKAKSALLEPQTIKQAIPTETQSTRGTNIAQIVE